MKTNQRDVQLCAHETSARGKLWGYGYEALADLFGSTAASLRTQASRGKLPFHPNDLRSICAAWAARQNQALTLSVAPPDVAPPDVAPVVPSEALQTLSAQLSRIEHLLQDLPPKVGAQVREEIVSWKQAAKERSNGKSWKNKDYSSGDDPETLAAISREGDEAPSQPPAREVQSWSPDATDEGRQEAEAPIGEVESDPGNLPTAWDDRPTTASDFRDDRLDATRVVETEDHVVLSDAERRTQLREIAMKVRQDATTEADGDLDSFDEPEPVDDQETQAQVEADARAHIARVREYGHANFPLVVTYETTRSRVERRVRELAAITPL